MQKLKSCSFFLTSMWKYLHQNAQFESRFIIGPENVRFASLCVYFLVLKIYRLRQ